jgi:hypothetical protein
MTKSRRKTGDKGRGTRKTPEENGNLPAPLGRFLTHLPYKLFRIYPKWKLEKVIF